MASFIKTASRCVRLAGLAITLGALIHLILRLTAFVHIFFDHAGIVLTQEEILQASSIGRDSRTAVVPRITHQIFHNWTHPENEVLPEDWKATRQTCIDTNEDWEHRLWTAKMSTDFVTQEYLWFLPTYNNFQYPVQKIDALRYLLMRHYGGIYIDLDNGCKTSLEPLRYYPAWTTDGGCGALSNNILGAEPNHPYWILMTDSMISHAWIYPLPYLTVMYASGQWYLTKIWEEFHQQLPQDSVVLTRVLMDSRPGASSWVFFTHTRGGTWNHWDNLLFDWIGENLSSIAVLLVAVGMVCSVTGFKMRAVSRKGRREVGCQSVKETS